jgi:antagonist of KipI
MSLTIIKAGILDSFQDVGRYGYQHSGINPNGAMDGFSARLANCLLGKEMTAPVIEMHFPAPTIQFSKSTIICIAGADFSPFIDNKTIPLHQPVIVRKNALLQFKKVRSGARCYLSILHKIRLEKWLSSYSTNLKANAGGFEGRALKTGDIINFDETVAVDDYSPGSSCRILSWKAEPVEEVVADVIEVIEGPEWNWLTKEGQQTFIDRSFTISNNAGRMGYRLTGPQMILKEQKQMISSGVSFGTVQLLPNGQLIVLMADHQTTGGYPRIANIISAHLPALAQKKPNDMIAFRVIEIGGAEKKLLRQHQYLQSIQYASEFKIKNLLNDNLRS